MSSPASVSTPKSAIPAPDLGPDAEALRKKGLRRLLVSGPVYGAAIVFLGASALFSVASTSHWLIVSSFIGGSFVAFYLLLLSGWSRRLADPMLTFPQVIVNIGNVALVYALADSSRAASLLWLSLIIVFDIQRLASHQMRVAALLAMALPIVVLLVTIPPDAPPKLLRDQLIFLAWGSAQVPALLFVAGRARRVRRRMQQLRTDLANAVNELDRSARTDGLTGLANRACMQARLVEEDLRFDRTQADYCIALLDIDHFKRINDAHGHAVGDAVLRGFAALARSALFDALDVVARWGGEEFLVLMPEHTKEEACAAMARLQALVHAVDWETIQPGLHVSFSAGVAIRSEVLNTKELITRADEALYRAKHGGRDRIEPPAPPPEGDIPPPPDLQALMEKASSATPVNDIPVEEIRGEETARPHLKPKRRGSPLLDLLLGADDALRGTTASVLVAAAIYLVMMVAIQLHGIGGGLMPVSIGHLLLTACGIAAVLPYALVRSGLTRNWQDRSLAVSQMIWALLIITAGFIVVPAARANILQIISLVLIFGFINLHPRQTLAVGAAACTFPLIGLVVMFIGEFQHGSGAHEIIQVLSAVFVFTLITAISHNFALLRERLRQERRKLASTAEQIRTLAIQDGLTGLANRAHATKLLRSELERSDRTGRPFSIALVDLDHFKQINDSHGHQIGDEVLQYFGRCATEAMRATDVVARWGGEEFLILLPEASPGENALTPVERLRVRLSEAIVAPSVPDLRVTLSAGVATRHAGECLAVLMERADSALYVAKNNGRNRCVLSTG